MTRATEQQQAVEALKRRREAIQKKERDWGIAKERFSTMIEELRDANTELVESATIISEERMAGVERMAFSLREYCNGAFQNKASGYIDFVLNLDGQDDDEAMEIVDLIQQVVQEMRARTRTEITRTHSVVDEARVREEQRRETAARAAHMLRAEREQSDRDRRGSISDDGSRRSSFSEMTREHVWKPHGELDPFTEDMPPIQFREWKKRPLPIWATQQQVTRKQHPLTPWRLSPGAVTTPS